MMRSRSRIPPRNPANPPRPLPKVPPPLGGRGCWGPMLTMSSSVRTGMPLPPGLGRRGDPPAQEWFLADLLLEFQEALIQRFRSRRAAGDVDVHRDDLVDAFENGVVVVVKRSAAGRATAHADHVFRLGHLLPQPTDEPRGP